MIKTEPWAMVLLSALATAAGGCGGDDGRRPVAPAGQGQIDVARARGLLDQGLRDARKKQFETAREAFVKAEKYADHLVREEIRHARARIDDDEAKFLAPSIAEAAKEERCEEAIDDAAAGADRGPGVASALRERVGDKIIKCVEGILEGGKLAEGRKLASDPRTSKALGPDHAKLKRAVNRAVSAALEKAIAEPVAARDWAAVLALTDQQVKAGIIGAKKRAKVVALVRAGIAEDIGKLHAEAVASARAGADVLKKIDALLAIGWPGEPVDAPAAEPAAPTAAPEAGASEPPVEKKDEKAELVEAARAEIAAKDAEGDKGDKKDKKEKSEKSEKKDKGDKGASAKAAKDEDDDDDDEAPKAGTPAGKPAPPEKGIPATLVRQRQEVAFAVACGAVRCKLESPTKRWTFGDVALHPVADPKGATSGSKVRSGTPVWLLASATGLALVTLREPAGLGEGAGPRAHAAAGWAPAKTLRADDTSETMPPGESLLGTVVWGPLREGQALFELGAVVKLGKGGQVTVRRLADRQEIALPRTKLRFGVTKPGTKVMGACADATKLDPSLIEEVRWPQYEQLGDPVVRLNCLNAEGKPTGAVKEGQLASVRMDPAWLPR
jgi:hypothetical protein